MADAYKIAMAKAAQDYAEAVAKAAALEVTPDEKTPEQEPEPQPTPEGQSEFNAAAFFDVIRAGLFGGSLNQGQVDGHTIIGNACSVAGLDPVLEQSAYILRTVYHETARTMQPIEEYGGWNTRYAPWFGRGYVQLTWEENYQETAGQATRDRAGAHLQNPVPGARRLESSRSYPRTSAIITVGGMRDGDFTGKKLSDYIKARIGGLCECAAYRQWDGSRGADRRLRERV